MQKFEKNYHCIQMILAIKVLFNEIKLKLLASAVTEFCFLVTNQVQVNVKTKKIIY